MAILCGAAEADPAESPSPPKKHCVFLKDSGTDAPKVPAQDKNTEVVRIPPNPTDFGDFTAWAAIMEPKLRRRYSRYDVNECGLYACDFSAVPCSKAGSDDPFHLHMLGEEMQSTAHFCNQLYLDIRLYENGRPHFDEYSIGGPTDGLAGLPGDYGYSGLQLYLLKSERLLEISLTCDSVQGYTEAADPLFRKIERFVTTRLEKIETKYSAAYAAMPPLPQDLGGAISEYCERHPTSKAQQIAVGTAAKKLQRRNADLQRRSCEKMADLFKRFKSLHESQVSRSR